MPGQCYWSGRWRPGKPKSRRAARLIRRSKQTRTSLFIGEFRLLPDSFRLPEWGDAERDEPGIAIGAIILAVDQYELQCQWCLPKAFVGRHALGRWYQRAERPTNERLHEDLISVAAHAAEVMSAADPECTINTASGGAWRGTVLPDPECDDTPLVRVRSFY